MAHCMMIVPLLISLCLILPLIQASKFQYCGLSLSNSFQFISTKILFYFNLIESSSFFHADNNKDYDVKVSGVKISPNPVKKGKPATFTISATTSDYVFLSYGN